MLSFRGVTYLRRLVTAVVAAVALLMLAGNPASASGRTPVDPSIMQPALNPTFTWECWRVDNQTVCDGERHLSWTAADNAIPFVAPGDATVFATLGAFSAGAVFPCGSGGVIVLADVGMLGDSFTPGHNLRFWDNLAEWAKAPP